MSLINLLSSKFGGRSSSRSFNFTDVSSALAKLTTIQSSILRAKYVSDSHSLNQLVRQSTSYFIQHLNSENIDFDRNFTELAVKLVVCEFILNVCPHCKGSGVINKFTSKESKCTHCNGKGSFELSAAQRKNILKSEKIDKEWQDRLDALKGYLSYEEQIALNELKRLLS